MRACTTRLLPLGLAALAACGDDRQAADWASPIPFDSARVWVHAGGDSVPLLVELARTDAQRQFGLMTRPALDSGSGMLFLYDGEQPGENGFWMFRTRVPLDIAFLDGAGVIQAILEMAPCESPYPEACPLYRPGVPYRSALEVNRGWFAAHGVSEGARVELGAISSP